MARIKKAKSAGLGILITLLIVLILIIGGYIAFIKSIKNTDSDVDLDKKDNDGGIIDNGGVNGGNGNGDSNGDLNKKTFCTSEQRGKDVCIEIYQPVCGWSDPEKIQCITYPCASTYSNSCFACIDENVLYFTEGECPPPM